MKNVRLFPYDPASESVKRLSESTGILRIRGRGETFKFHPKYLVINYGYSGPVLDGVPCKVINPPSIVRLASNKVSFFRYASAFMDEGLVPFTEDFEVAKDWLAEKSTVMARTVLNGHSGEGIYIMEHKEPQDWVKAPLYTKYIPKKAEFRFHIADGETFLVQKKIRKGDTPIEDVNWKIRNLANGFVYQRNDVKVPDSVTAVVNKFIAGSKNFLDFYALDVIYNEKNDKAYILEANTAPGLSASTLDDYTKVITRMVERRL